MVTLWPLRFLVISVATLCLCLLSRILTELVALSELLELVGLGACLASPLSILVLSIIRLVTIVRSVGLIVVILRPTRQFPVLSFTVRVTHDRLVNAARNSTCVVGLAVRTLCVVLKLSALGTRTLTSSMLGWSVGALKQWCMVVLLLPVAYSILVALAVARTALNDR